MSTMTATPASVRWGLLLMAALLLSQVIGLHRVGPARETAGLQAAPLASQPSSRDSLEHEAGLAVASKPACQTETACGTSVPGRRSC